MSDHHHGLYWRHECPRCRRIQWDSLPMLRCRSCHSDEVVVTFDNQKRALELGQQTGCQVASELKPDRSPSGVSITSTGMDR